MLFRKLLLGWNEAVSSTWSRPVAKPAQHKIESFQVNKMTYTLQVVEQQRYPWLHDEYGGVFINVGLPFSPIIRVFVGNNSRGPEFC